MAVLRTETVSDEVRRIRLDRPEKLNALNKRVLREFAAAVRDASDDGIRVLVVDGAGDAFCSGADLDESAEEDEDIELYQETTRAVRAFEGAVIGKLGSSQLKSQRLL